MNELYLTLVTPEKKIVEHFAIEEVYIPAYRGELGILPGHAPLMTTLNTGVLRYRARGESTMNFVAISWGYCEVSPQGVLVLAETAEKQSEIDPARAKKALESAWLSLKRSDLTPEDAEKYQNKARRAQTRLQLTR